MTGCSTPPTSCLVCFQTGNSLRARFKGLILQTFSSFLLRVYVSARQTFCFSPSFKHISGVAFRLWTDSPPSLFTFFTVSMHFQVNKQQLASFCPFLLFMLRPDLNFCFCEPSSIQDLRVQHVQVSSATYLSESWSPVSTSLLPLSSASAPLLRLLPAIGRISGITKTPPVNLDSQEQKQDRQRERESRLGGRRK